MKITVTTLTEKVNAGELFNAASYPESNKWYHVTDSNLAEHIVYVGFSDNGSIPFVYDMPFTKEMITEDEFTENTSKNIPPSGCISENTLLKALAIAQNPELAKDLVLAGQ